MARTATAAARPGAGLRHHRSSRSAAVARPDPPARAGTRTRGGARATTRIPPIRTSEPVRTLDPHLVGCRSEAHRDFFFALARRGVWIQIRPSRMQSPAARATASTSPTIRGGDDRLPSPATHGEAALVIPTIAASRKPTTTTAATGGRPHAGRASPSITHSLRCSLIADLRRYATESLTAARPRPISAAGTACRRAPARPAP